MKSIKQALAAAALVAAILPGVALAHNDGSKDNGDKNDIRASINATIGAKADDRFQVKDLDNLLDQKANIQVREGTVTAIGTNSFTLQGNDGTVYTVNTSSATVTLPFDGKFTIGNLAVNDAARVRGTLSGNVITAASIIVLPQNTTPVRAKATVTAVNGSNLTVTTKNNNVVTVSTDANTTVTKADGTVGTTADVQVGTMVKIKGLWNSVLSTLKAIKIRLV